MGRVVVSEPSTSGHHDISLPLGVARVRKCQGQRNAATFVRVFGR